MSLVVGGAGSADFLWSESTVPTRCLAPEGVGEFVIGDLVDQVGCGVDVASEDMISLASVVVDCDGQHGPAVHGRLIRTSNNNTGDCNGSAFDVQAVKFGPNSSTAGFHIYIPFSGFEPSGLLFCRLVIDFPGNRPRMATKAATPRSRRADSAVRVQGATVCHVGRELRRHRSPQLGPAPRSEAVFRDNASMNGRM